MAREEIQLYREECCSCHLLFWISEEHHSRLRNTKETFYCPNGHSQSYDGKTSEQKLKECKEEKERIKGYWDESCNTSNKYYEKWQKAEKELKKLKPKEEKKIKVSKSYKKKPSPKHRNKSEVKHGME